MSGRRVDLSELLLGMRRRAKFSRLTAYSMLAVLVVIGAATAYFFLQWSNSEHVVVTTAGNSTIIGTIEARAESGGLDWLSEITRAFVRIASVIMSVFIINILVSFARYNLRAANYLESRADCIALTDGDLEQVALVLPSISVDVLDFIKTPMTPYDAYLDVLRGIFPRQHTASTLSDVRSRAGDQADEEDKILKPRPVHKS